MENPYCSCELRRSCARRPGPLEYEPANTGGWASPSAECSAALGKISKEVGLSRNNTASPPARPPDTSPLLKHQSGRRVAAGINRCYHLLTCHRMLTNKC